MRAASNADLIAKRPPTCQSASEIEYERGYDLFEALSCRCRSRCSKRARHGSIWRLPLHCPSRPLKRSRRDRWSCREL